MIRKLFHFILFLLALYGVALGYLYFKQRELLFHPDSMRPVLVGDDADNYIELKIKTVDGLSLLSWYHLAAPNMPTILYFHGNAGSISSRAQDVLPYLSHGYGMLLLEYRGFSGNPGTPTELGLYNDARAAIKMLGEYNIPPSNIILFGESLGTAVAVQMATEFPVKAVILQSPFDSAVKLASAMYRYFPVDFLMKDRFDSISKIKNLHAPLLVLHGTADITVPISFGQRLYDAANDPKLFISYPEKGHSDIVSTQMQNEVVQFLQVLQTQ